MIVEVTYKVELEIITQPITKEEVEEAFAAFCRGETSTNDREVSLTWKIVRE